MDEPPQAKLKKQINNLMESEILKEIQFKSQQREKEIPEVMISIEPNEGMGREIHNVIDNINKGIDSSISHLLSTQDLLQSLKEVSY